MKSNKKYVVTFLLYDRIAIERFNTYIGALQRIQDAFQVGLDTKRENGDFHFYPPHKIEHATMSLVDEPEE